MGSGKEMEFNVNVYGEPFDNYFKVLVAFIFTGEDGIAGCKYDCGHFFTFEQILKIELK